MKINLNSTVLALVSILFASVSWGQSEDRTRAAASTDDQEQEQKITECIQQLKEKRKGITDYSARKACTAHVKKQADREDRSSAG